MRESVTVHLEPVNVCLVRYTKNTFCRRKDNDPLHQLVKAHLHLLIDHAIIGDASLIHLDIIFIIRHVVPQCLGVGRLKRTDIQTGKIRG